MIETTRNLTAAVLAGGLGTRLRPVIGEHAKVLAHVGERPLLSSLFDQLLDVGVRRVVLCVGYRAREVVDTYGDRYGRLHIEYSREQSPLGTGGALRRALPRLDSPSVLVMNGDTFFTGDINDFIGWHEHHLSSCSMVLTKREDTSACGRVQLSPLGVVDGFEEKSASAGPGWVNAGLYMMCRGFIAGIPVGRFVSLEREILPACAGKHLLGYCSSERFLDIGTPEGLRRANAYFEERSGRSSRAVGHGH